MNTAVPTASRPADGPQLAGFRARCEEVAGAALSSPAALHAFSVDRSDDFWRTFLDWSELVWEGSNEPVRIGDDVQRACFFPGVRLNYAENLLRPLPDAADDAPALTSVHGDGSVDRLTRGGLRTAVYQAAEVLGGLGLGVGDRVVMIAPNHSPAVVAALATAAIGATLSTATPDLGASALLGRFGQVDPVALLLDRSGMARGDVLADDVLAELLAGLPTVRHVLMLDDGPPPTAAAPDAIRLADLLAAMPAGRVAAPWPRLPFDHPLWVMFSSGTTGPPKAMVHGAGGSLIEHVKEHRLHGDLQAGDTLYFHTTTAWMMWNWQLSALAVGAHVVLYDGAVTGPETLWELVAAHGVTVFGASPAYLQLCQDEGYRPRDAVDLRRVRAVLSTGAVLHEWQYTWVAEAVGPVPLQSISGGTDIIGCFVLGHPEQPVRLGRTQSLSLGLDVVALDGEGRPVFDEVGELVCRRPFPSRPVGFLADPGGARFTESYFAQHPGFWTHGDLIEVGRDGSARMHGRSDGLLNVSGVRIGPSEIYTIVRRLPEVAGAMAVEQSDPDASGVTRLVLMVVPARGARLDQEFEQRVRALLRREGSPAHVPSLVIAVPELPMTHNGKLSERAAREALNGDPVHNLDALRNPGSLMAIAAAARDAAAINDVDASADVAEAGGVDDVLVAVTRAFHGMLGAPVSDTANFFDAGGTSRQSIRLVRQLRHQLDVDVPMSAFLSDPSIRGMVSALTTATEERPAIELLVPGERDEAPLFLVHGTFGDVDDYQNVQHLLDVSAPVFGLRGRLAGPDGSSRSLRELAGGHAEVLDAFQPSGPLRLAGYSFGGLLAFEIARQLTARGRVVSFLGLLDVQPPAASLSRGQQLLKRAASLLAAVFHVERRTLTGVVLDRIRPQRSTAYFDSPHGRALKVYDAYRWESYGGPVTFFRAARRVPVLTHQLYAWRRIAPRMTVIDTPGMHYDMVDRENARALAARLSDALRASDSRDAVR